MKEIYALKIIKQLSSKNLYFLLFFDWSIIACAIKFDFANMEGKFIVFAISSLHDGFGVFTISPKGLTNNVFTIFQILLI